MKDRKSLSAKITFSFIFLFSFSGIIYPNFASCQTKTQDEYFKEYERLTDSDQYAKASKVLKEMIAAYPESKPFFSYMVDLNLAISFAMRGDLKTAEKVFGDALNKYPERKADMLRIFAGYYADRGSYDKALLSFKKSIELDPGYTSTYYAYALTLKKKGLYEEAEKQCRLYLNSEPADYKGWWVLGNIAVEEKKYDAALEWYKRALKLNPKEDQVFYGIGYTYLKKWDYINAVKYFVQIPGRRIQAILVSVLICFVFFSIVLYFKEMWQNRNKTSDKDKKWLIGVSIFFAIQMFLITRNAWTRIIDLQGPRELFLFSILSIEAIILYFLFRLRNWARIALLIYWVILYIIAVLTAIFSNEWRQQVTINQQLYFVGFFLYALLFIYFFTRQQVKAIFRKEPITKQKSMGIIVFGYLAIVLGIINYLLDSLGIAAYYKDQKLLMLMPFVILFMMTSICEVVFGVGILRLKEWARKSALIISGLVTIVYLLYLYIYSYILKIPLTFFDIGIVEVSLAFPLILIYFLTRPKVVEQFK